MKRTNLATSPLIPRGQSTVRPLSELEVETEPLPLRHASLPRAVFPPRHISIPPAPFPLPPTPKVIPQQSIEASQQEFLEELKYGELNPYIQDNSIEEIWINSPNRIFIARGGVSELTNLSLTTNQVKDLVERLLMWGGRRLDLSHPFVDARLPDGSRLHASIPDVTAEHWAVNIRKHILRGKTLAELQEIGVLDQNLQHFLTRCVTQGLNILVSGSTQAGKTTLLNALIAETPSKSRVITVEEVFELKPRIADCVALQTRPANLEGEGEIPLRKLIKEALRMRPTHLVVGEIREAESLDLLIALNSGLPGMATIHANSARDAITKLQTLPLLAGENISHRFIAPVVANAIDIVVHVAMDSQGKRAIQEVLYVSGRIEGDRVETENLFLLESEGDTATYRPGIGDIDRIFAGKGVKANAVN